MLKVGLTGGIGSGKSTVATIFEMLGVPVYYSDQRAKELMVSDKIRPNIISAFGHEAYDAKGKLERTYLAREVFNDSTKLETLNSIVHPAVEADFREWASAQTTESVIQEAAILIESGAYRDMDCIIVVQAPIETRIERVIKRDGATRSDVERRINAQMSDCERVLFADFTITADGIQLLLPQIVKIKEKLATFVRKN